MSDKKSLRETIDDVVEDMSKFIMQLHRIKDRVEHLLPSPYDDPYEYAATCLETIELGHLCTEKNHHKSCFRYKKEIDEL